MKRVLPGRVELAVFIVMAAIGGLLVATSGQRDAMIFFVTLPLFMVAVLMGYRRSLVAPPIRQVVEEETPVGNAEL
jgi:hypothetical protein